jgi:putative zinc finger/helix-turn-helix YgiT family protein
MSVSHVCPFCGEGVATEVAYSSTVKFGRKNILVEGLKKTVCSACNSESVPEQLYDQNHLLIQKAGEYCQGAVSEEMLRDFRVEWSLTQAQASEMFGAGASSFAKWESQQTNISTPAALLVQVANKFPKVVVYLAAMANVPLSCQSAGVSKIGARRPKLFGGYESICMSSHEATNGVYMHSPQGRGSTSSKARSTVFDWERATA